MSSFGYRQAIETATEERHGHQAAAADEVRPVHPLGVVAEGADVPLTPLPWAEEVAIVRAQVKRNRARWARLREEAMAARRRASARTERGQAGVPAGRRRCQGCKQVLPLDRFVRDAAACEGRAYRCYPCDRFVQRAHAAKRRAKA